MEIKTIRILQRDFFIYEESKKSNQLNDKNTFYNKIFEVILNTDSHLTSQPSQPPPSVVTKLLHSRQQDTAAHKCTYTKQLKQ
jgi:hypothetical protein